MLLHRLMQEIKQREDAAVLAAQVYQEKFLKLADCPVSPRIQALKDYRDRKEAAENLKRERGKEKLPVPPSSNVEGQRVLGEAFCINRLDSIRQSIGWQCEAQGLHERCRSGYP